MEMTAVARYSFSPRAATPEATAAPRQSSTMSANGQTGSARPLAGRAGSEPTERYSTCLGHPPDVGAAQDHVVAKAPVEASARGAQLEGEGHAVRAQADQRRAGPPPHRQHEDEARGRPRPGGPRR